MSRPRRITRSLLAGTLGLAFAFVAASADAADWSKAKTVTVVTVEYRFEPSALKFHSGVVYRLHLDNRGKETHEFTAPAFFKTIEMRDAGVVNADRTEIVIQPGEEKDLFFVAGRPGHYALTCSDHDWAGMVGSIAVVP